MLDLKCMESLFLTLCRELMADNIENYLKYMRIRYIIKSIFQNCQRRLYEKEYYRYKKCF